MTKSINIALACAIALLTCACGKSDRFRIKAQITGIGAQSVAMTYYAAGGLKRTVTPADNGRVSFEGVSPTPTLATVTMSDGTPIATLVVRNGDRISLKANVDDPLALEVKGNSASEKMAEWMSDNAHHLHAGDAEKINESIARFVTANKSNPAATALMVTQFRTEGYEITADSLFSLIDPQARPAAVVQNFSSVLSAQLSTTANADLQTMTLYGINDTIVTFNPRRHSVSMLCFVPSTRTVRDSVIPKIREICQSYPDDSFRAVEISTAADSALWRKSIEPDSASWPQTWAPGSVAAVSVNKLAIPRLPYFIVADSAGGQIYRGASVSAAIHTVKDKLH